MLTAIKSSVRTFAEASLSPAHQNVFLAAQCGTIGAITGLITQKIIHKIMDKSIYDYRKRQHRIKIGITIIGILSMWNFYAIVQKKIGIAEPLHVGTSMKKILGVSTVAIISAIGLAGIGFYLRSKITSNDESDDDLNRRKFVANVCFIASFPTALVALPFVLLLPGKICSIAGDKFAQISMTAGALGTVYYGYGI